MNVDAIPASPTSSGTERFPVRAAVWVGTAGAVASGIVAAVALVVAGTDASPALVVVAVLAAAWAAAGVAVATYQRCPAVAVIVGVAASIGIGALAWSVDVHRTVSDGQARVVDAGQVLALCATPALILHLLLGLPNGTFARPGSRRLVLATYVVAAGVAVAMLAGDDPAPWWSAPLWAATLAGGSGAHANYRRSTVAEQRRLQWIGWAVVVAVEVALVCSAMSFVADWPDHPAEIALAGTGLVPLAVVAGVIPRFQTRASRLLTHTVSLTGLTALIVVAYLCALAAFGRKPDGGERSLLLLSMLAAGGAALAYQPARSRLTELANRVVYGERTSPDEALRTWGSRLTRAIPLDELLLQLVETLRKSMQLRSAQIWTGENGHYEIAAMVPHRTPEPYTIGPKEQAVVSRAGVSGGTWLGIWLPGLVPGSAAATTRVAPIAFGGALLGLIVCERTPDGESFTDEDDRVLTELARQVGLALHNVQLDTALQASLDELRETNEELRASRSRIVAAGDSERRKLERNLHDGAQQHLVALAVRLRLARDTIADDPEDAAGQLDDIRAGMQEAITELRSLAHGIFPPLLVSGGLADALPAAAGRAALPTTTDIAVSRHDQELEAAIYFCCMEALQNAGKHAGPGASAVIRVWEDEAALHWEVSDDGLGFDVASSAAVGHGFVNLRDRMGAFGGTVDVRTGPGSGTTVGGQVPLG